MHHHEVDPPSPSGESALSLPRHVAKFPSWVTGGPLTSHPPQLLDLPFELPGSNFPQLEAADESMQLSSTILTQTDIEDAAVPVLQTNSTQRCRQSPIRNFSLPIYHPEKPRPRARYYATALASDDRAALMRGDMNHNLIPWTPKDLILDKESYKDLRPINTYTGLDKQVCIIPVIIVTQGESKWTHIQQLRHQYHATRSSSAPSTQPTQPELIAQSRARMYARGASNGGYFAKVPRPASHRYGERRG